MAWTKDSEALKAWLGKARANLWRAWLRTWYWKYALHVLLMVVIAIPLLDFVCHETNYATYYAAKKIDGARSRILIDTWRNTNTLWTAAASMAACGALVFLWMEIRTTGQSFMLSREASRGRLLLRVMQDASGALKYEIQNSGNGVVSIDGYSIQAKAFRLDSLPPSAKRVNRGMLAEEVLRPDNIFRMPLVNHLMRREVPEAERLLYEAGDRLICIQFDVFYDTLGEHYWFRETRVIRRSGNHVASYPVFGKKRRFDKKRSRIKRRTESDIIERVEHKIGPSNQVRPQQFDWSASSTGGDQTLTYFVRHEVQIQPIRKVVPDR